LRRRAFGFKMQQVAGGCRRLHSAELRDWHLSSNIARGEADGLCMWHVWGRRGARKGFWLETVKENFEDLDTNGGRGNIKLSPFRWPRFPRRGSAVARLPGLRVRILSGAWMSVCCECCVFCQVEVSASSCSIVQRSPTECGVSGFDVEISAMRRPRPTRAIES
jgi:hypothetical protein